MRYQEAKKVTLVSAFFNACLALGKIIIGTFSGSHGIFADGLHSMSDLLTDFLVIIASKYGSQEADEDHPYGHHRIETAATFFLSMLLVVTGVGILWDSLQHAMADTALLDGTSAFLMIMLSLVVNEGLFHYTLFHGKRLDSQLLIANAWHHRGDSLSSFVVLLGLLGNILGFYYLDAIAASIVGLLIIKMGWSLGWGSMKELVDTSIPLDELKKINHEIAQTDGVIAVHQLRTRSMAGKVLVDVHVLVKPTLSVSEGHHIGQAVALAIRGALPSVSDVTVHIDPEDDEVANPSIDLPARETLLPELFEYWQGHLQQQDIEVINLHYLDGAIHIECFVNKGIHFDVARCRAMALSLDCVNHIEFYHSI